MKHLRIQLGISQQQLADHLKVPRSVISMAELGKRPYPEDFISKIDEIHKSRTDLLAKGKVDNELHQVYKKETIIEMQKIIEANNYLLYTSSFKLGQALNRLKRAEVNVNLSEKANHASQPQNNNETDISESRINMASRRFRQKEAIEKMNIALLELKIKTLEFERDEAEKWVKENGG